VAARIRELDRPLLAVTLLLAAFGLATLYSAGQTDVPTFVTTIWLKQVIWLGVALVAVILVFRVSPRLLEWATPYVYLGSVVLLLLTLVFGTGTGAARRRAARPGSPSPGTGWGSRPSS